MNKENKENLIPVKGLSPFKRFCMTIGELPTSYLETMTYYEMLVWFTKYMQDTVIPTINNNASAVDELQNKYIEFTDNLLDRQTTFENNLTERQENYEEEVMTLFNNLQDFVNNYFNNLDVQEEINNKLDQMVEDGILQEIIANYLNSKAIFGFDNVAQMKEATNLINGSYARTLGYYSKNDKGGALYKIREITNDDTIDESFIIEMPNNLVAELIYSDINIKQLGAKGNATDDDTSYFQKALNKINNKTLYIDNSTYIVDDTLLIDSKHDFKINCDGCLKAISSNSEKDIILITNSYNFEINGIYLTSTLDKTEVAPADHIRQNYAGSNRQAIRLSNCNNAKLNNIKTENMFQDIKLNKPDALDETFPNHDIYINNWKSINSSMCFLSLYSKNIYINNADVNLKQELGDGNHFFYLERYCENIYFNNIIANVEDTYIKYGFNLYEGHIGTEASAPKEIYVNNCYMKAPSFLALQKYSSFHCNNIKFEGFDSLAENSNFFIVSISNSEYTKLYINECHFYNFKTPFLYLYKSEHNNVEITNSKIENYEDTYDQYLIATGNSNCSNNDIILKNNILNIKSIIYINNSTQNLNTYLFDNKINSIASNWLFSIRNTNNILFSSNNVIQFKTTIPKVIYNGSTTDSPGITLLNTYINNATILGFNVEIASLVKLNSYLNNTLIS